MTTMFTLTVRGTTNFETLDAARTQHNNTAGSEPGKAAARALSDLSHQVWVPCAAAKDMGGTNPKELLFLDVWTNPAGLNDFFSDKNTQEAAAKMFSVRDGQLWVPAANAFGFELPAPSTAKNRFLGMIRVKVPSIEKATELFKKVNEPLLASARAGGQLSHKLFFKFTGPASAPAAELLGLDVWTDLAAMGAHYGKSMPGLAEAFAGKPETSIWEASTGFNEW